MFLVKTVKSAKTFADEALGHMASIRRAADAGDPLAYNGAFDSAQRAIEQAWAQAENAWHSAVGARNVRELGIANRALEWSATGVMSNSLGNHFQIYGGKVPTDFGAAIEQVAAAQQALGTVLRAGERPLAVGGVFRL